MIALKKEWLTNLRIQEDAEKYLQKGCISPAEFNSACNKYPVGFYMPNVFVRLGLFILTFFIMLMGDGLLTLMASAGNVLDSPVWPLFLGVISYACLEGLIASKQHFRSGVDDALLIITFMLFSYAFFLMSEKGGMSDNNRNACIAFLLFIITFYFTIRFVDILMAAICFSSFFATIFYLWNSVGFGGLSTVPFVVILVSAGVYRLINRLLKNPAFINYEGCLQVAQVLSLLVLYAAGNYFVVQTLGNALNPGQPADKPLPLGAFFWPWTLLVPIIYLVFGIRKKDAILLRTGLVLIAAAVTTFRTYYHLLPTDIMLALAGVLIIALTWWLIRYLKTAKFGFTYREDDEQTLLDHARIGSLITAQSVAGIGTDSPQNGSHFGGGDFGGGGSSGNF